MEQCRSITPEVTVQAHKLHESLCNVMSKFENDHNIQTVINSLTSLSESVKKFETDARLMMESLLSLNETMKEFENGTKSIVDELTDYCDYKDALDDLNSLLENFKSHNPRLCLEMMGCDWVRHLEIMCNDMQKGK